MSRSTANVSFYCRESKKNKDGLAPIEMVIILNTRRCFIQLPRKEYPSQFKAQFKGKKRTDLIEYLDGIRARLNQIITTFLMEGQPLTADALKAYFQNGGYVLYTIGDLCGIDKPIFSHVARHTYATRCLNRGIRLEVVAKLLGHSTTKITQHYAKLLKKQHFERS